MGRGARPQTSGHRKNIKTPSKFLVVLLAIFVVAQAHAMRWYSPSTGSWFSRDPIGEPGFELRLNWQGEVLPVVGEHNLYTFVGNSPVNAIDLFGLFSSFENCSCCQIDALKLDETIAQAHIALLTKRIQAVLPDILANPSKYPYRTGFKFNTALTRLGKASAKLKSGTVKCEPGSGPIARAWPWGNTVQVYEAYWYFTDFGQGAHLVHEGTHMGAATTDAAYFWQSGEAPHDTFFVPWNSIASTYDSWIINGFCIPGFNCPPGQPYDPQVPHIKRGSKECP